MTLPRRNLATLLEDLAREPERPAYVLRTAYRTFRWSAGQTRRCALQLAWRLQDRGVRPGERVLLQGPNSPEWCAAFLGIVAVGAVPVPLDETSSAEFTRSVQARVGARGGCIVEARARELQDRLSWIEILEHIATHDSPELDRAHDADPADTAQIVFTSGTTSAPRGVELTHANLLSALTRIERGFRRREWFLRPLLPMRFLCLVPLSHLFGQSLGLLLPILMRSTGVFSSAAQPARVIDALRGEAPLAVITTPRMLEGLRSAILRELERRGRRERFERRLRLAAGRSWWRRAWSARDLRGVLGWRTWVWVVGGAALDPELETFWTASGYALIQGYGMTEAAPIIAIHNPLDGRVHTLGRPIAGVEVRVADDGELLVRGPNVMRGYLGDPEATRQTLRDGWLHTGDLVERDDDGRLYFKGRKKDVIVTPSGMNVFVTDVERVLEAIPGVKQAVVFGVRGPHGEQVQAAVLADADAADTDELRSRANQRLAPHQRLRKLVRWERLDFPRTATGKVRRGAVAAAVTGTAAVTEVDADRLERVLEQLQGRSASRETRLAEDLGLDSLEIVDLVGRVEEEYGISLDDRAVAPSLTLGEIEAAMKGRSGRALRLTMPRWSRRWPARALRRLLDLVLVRPLFRVFVRLSVEGREHVERIEPPLLIVANHTSALDVPAVRSALPARLGSRLAPAMAIETLPEHFDAAARRSWKRLRSSLAYGLAVLLFDAYPLPQTMGFRPSLRYTGELVDGGACPLVFPEGRMSRDGRIGRFKKGIGLLAAETRVSVLPIYLEGLGELLPPGGRWPRRGPARVVIGRALDPLAGGEPGDAAAVAGTIERAVRELSRGAR